MSDTDRITKAAPTPVTATDVRAAMAKARHDAMVSAAEAGPWAVRFGSALMEGLADMVGVIAIRAAADGSVDLHSAHGRIRLEYIEPYLVHLVMRMDGGVDETGADVDNVTFDDSVTEREALALIAAWALQQREPG